MKTNFLIFFTLSQLYKSRVHLGVIKSNLNVNAFRYLLPIRNTFSLMNVHYTSTLLKTSFHYLLSILEHRGTVLIVNESKFLSHLLKRELGMLTQPISYLSWSPGLLSNFKSVRRNSLKAYFLKRQFILKLFRLDALGLLNSKTRNVIKSSFNFLKFRKELSRYIKSLNRLPNAVFAFDCVLSTIPLQEARKLSIASFGISDSNADSFNITYGIPGNSTSILSLMLYFRFLKLLFLKALLLERRHFLTDCLSKKKEYKGLNYLVDHYQKGASIKNRNVWSASSFYKYFIKKGLLVNPFLDFYNNSLLHIQYLPVKCTDDFKKFKLSYKNFFITKKQFNNYDKSSQVTSPDVFLSESNELNLMSFKPKAAKFIKQLYMNHISLNPAKIPVGMLHTSLLGFNNGFIKAPPKLIWSKKSNFFKSIFYQFFN